MASLISQMTRKAIESEIRKKTHIVNERLKQFYNEGNENIMVSSEINKLQSIAGKGRGKNMLGKMLTNIKENDNNFSKLIEYINNELIKEC